MFGESYADLESLWQGVKTPSLVTFDPIDVGGGRFSHRTLLNQRCCPPPNTDTMNSFDRADDQDRAGSEQRRVQVSWRCSWLQKMALTGGGRGGLAERLCGVQATVRDAAPAPRRPSPRTVSPRPGPQAWGAGGRQLAVDLELYSTPRRLLWRT